ncbi:hypothetical protein SAMN04487917_101348 [Arthrobacter sp. yr096]|uniref:hypothetical protein n=1 Tax=Arthrobacter sp. yr096 TaxID=1761750 RepID=UPI0008ABE62C|nr:hypothetical protein [Arthrobacter sp. yr096]SEI44859.1 hypothetical protein SAMN04487917_101348 [Arthrobacter sp. yr096]
MANCFPHGIDITAPGGFERLMAFHRLTFGDAQMNANPGTPADGGDGSNGTGQEPAAGAQPAAGVQPDEDQLGDAGKAALKVERDARSKAEKELAEAKAALQKIDDDKLSDIDKAKKEAAERETENQTLRLENAKLAALAKHPVPVDKQHLVTGTDAATFEASAKEISELVLAAAGKVPPANKLDPIPDAGRRSGGQSPSGGSVAAGRDLYESTNKKTNA